METTITAAAAQYRSRPPDERYPSLDALIATAQADRDASRERTYALRDLRAVPTDDQIVIESPRGPARLSHWAWGQLTSMVHAPGGYLASLPPDIGAACLNHGITSRSPHGSDAVMLVRGADSPEALPLIRAVTSDSYGRVWDAELYGEIGRYFGGHGWSLPPTWDGQPAGAYRGDRDSFVILTHGGSIVTDPSVRDGGEMYRGIMVRNSEVGACAVWIDPVLFRFVCGNHNLWGAIFDGRFKRRHVGKKALRDTLREVWTLARRWSERPESADAEIIRRLIDREIATTRDAVISELRKMGATQAQAEDAYTTAEIREEASPRSFWGIAQGLTRASQATSYQDDRLVLDRLAALVLQRGARVAA